MRVRLLPANEYQRVRWKNGLGWTREIARHPAGSEDWHWRLSIAEVDKPGPFSAFPGCERELVLLTGDGMRLQFEDGETAELLPPHDRHRFDGERPLHAELVGGPTQDFNVIWRRARIGASVLHRPLVGPMVFFAEANVTWAVHVLSGRAHVKDRADLPWLERGDTVLIEPDETGPRRVILDGGGELLVIRLEDRAGDA